MLPTPRPADDEGGLLLRTTSTSTSSSGGGMAGARGSAGSGGLGLPAPPSYIASTPRPASVLEAARSRSIEVDPASLDDDGEGAPRDDRGRARSESFHESAEEKATAFQRVELTATTPLQAQHLRILMLLEGEPYQPPSAREQPRERQRFPDVRMGPDEEAEEKALAAEEQRQLELWYKGGDGRGGGPPVRTSKSWSRKRRSSVETTMVPFADAPGASPARDAWLLSKCEARASLLVVSVGGGGLAPVASPLAASAPSSSSFDPAAATWAVTELANPAGRRTRCVVWEVTDAAPQATLEALALGCDVVLVSLAAESPDALASARRVLDALRSPGKPGPTLGVVTAKRKPGSDVRALGASYGVKVFDHGTASAVEAALASIAGVPGRSGKCSVM